MGHFTKANASKMQARSVSARSLGGGISRTEKKRRAKLDKAVAVLTDKITKAIREGITFQELGEATEQAKKAFYLPFYRDLARKEKLSEARFAAAKIFRAENLYQTVKEARTDIKLLFAKHESLHGALSLLAGEKQLTNTGEAEIDRCAALEAAINYAETAVYALKAIDRLPR